ncbi:CRISPR-associated endonuclease Cas2 [Candidatus Parcubacteria bacterium]|nr:MAG: CRISPR-associated endonuclease Cas2 [Candidatus Parcubacteria bacterium]
MGPKTRRHKLGPQARDILQELTLGDLLYAHLTSAGSTKTFYKTAHERAAARYRQKKTIERLEMWGYIERIDESLSITKDGALALGSVTNKTRLLLTSKTWDHKWRLATFDIPEKYAPLRNKVREILKKAGFVLLQQSVWVFPHECEELVQLIKQESKLSQYILYGVLERIENEERLKKIFGL